MVSRPAGRDGPAFPNGTRRIGRAKQRALQEIAWLMRRDGYSWIAIATVIGWSSPAAALRAAQTFERRRAKDDTKDAPPS